MGMTSCDTCWPPGNNTRNARNINSSALRCRASSTSVTSSCGENSGVRWQISTYSAHDSDKLEALDVLATKVGIRGIFSDWPATVTYYANCKGL